jgi:serine/threonine protein kinase
MQMFQGLAYLHAHRILHRDVKPANALIGADARIKLADFGISRLGLQHNTQTISGTPAYLSPDAINGRYSVASDIWALGCTVLELVTGQRPWAHLGLESSTQIIFAIGLNPTPYPLPDSISPHLRDLLGTMLNLDPVARTDCSRLLAHSWFSIDAAELPSAQNSHIVSEHEPEAETSAQVTHMLVQLHTCGNFDPPSVADGLVAELLGHGGSDLRQREESPSAGV